MLSTQSSNSTLSFAQAERELRAQIGYFQDLIALETCQAESAMLAYSQESIKSYYNIIKGRKMTHDYIFIQFYTTFLLVFFLLWVTWSSLRYSFETLLLHRAMLQVYHKLKKEDKNIKTEEARRLLGHTILRQAQRRLFFWCFLKVVLAAVMLIGMLCANTLVFGTLKCLLRVWWEGLGMKGVFSFLHDSAKDVSRALVPTSDTLAKTTTSFTSMVQSLYLWYWAGPMVLSCALCLLRSATEAQRIAREASTRQRQAYMEGSAMLHSIIREERQQNKFDIASMALMQLYEFKKGTLCLSHMDGGDIASRLLTEVPISLTEEPQEPLAPNHEDNTP